VQFNGVISIYHRLTLVAMVTKIWECWHRISYDWVYLGVMAKNPASNRGFSWSLNLTAYRRFTKDLLLLPW